MKNNSLIYFDSLENMEDDISIYDAIAVEMTSMNPMFYDESFLSKVLRDFHVIDDISNGIAGRPVSLDMLMTSESILTLIEMGNLNEFDELFSKVREKFYNDEKLSQKYYYNGFDELKGVVRALSKTIACVEVVKRIFKGMKNEQ